MRQIQNIHEEHGFYQLLYHEDLLYNGNDGNGSITWWRVIAGHSMI